ncbi:MAG: hypothetical protein GY750_14170 [Lentisphaerae bacterium]|nr:hypothetical protein [Lentisphaerota bacterium]MCP4102546.1 hypothetical protein [Lentisphaerota bacterium]
MKTVIMGSGNGAIALAAWQSYCKHDVTICALPDYDEHFPDFKDSKTLKMKGELEGVICLNEVTNNVKCVEDAKAVFIVVPSFAHENIFQKILPYLKNNQTIVVFPGNFASVTFRKMLESYNSDLTLNFVETDSLPFACRYEGNAVINIMGIKKCLSAGTYIYNKRDDKTSGEEVEIITALSPCKVSFVENIIATGLQNPNGVVHPITTMLNTGRIENENGAFCFYSEGMSVSIAKVIDKIDAERMSVSKALGYNLKSVIKWANDAYGYNFETLYSFLQNSISHNKMKGPFSLSNRYLQEDIPYSVIPWICLAEKVGVKTPMLKLTVDLASALLETDLHARENQFRELNLNEW